MTSATTGKKGYSGTLKGLSSPGSVRLRRNNEIMEIIYKVRAPKTEMTIISRVFLFNRSSVTIPIAEFTRSAIAGVLNRE